MIRRQRRRLKRLDVPQSPPSVARQGQGRAASHRDQQRGRSRDRVGVAAAWGHEQLVTVTPPPRGTRHQTCAWNTPEIRYRSAGRGGIREAWSACLVLCVPPFFVSAGLWNRSVTQARWTSIFSTHQVQPCRSCLSFQIRTWRAWGLRDFAAYST